MSFIMCHRICEHNKESHSSIKGDGKYYCRTYLMDTLPVEVTKTGRINCIGYEKRKKE